MALSLVLLAGSGLFVRTLVNLKTLDPGFDRRNVLLAGVSFNGPDPDDRVALAWQELLRRAAAIPGVDSASASIGGPFGGASMKGGVRIEGGAGQANLEGSWLLSISSNFFRTLGGRLAAGRDFAAHDFVPGAPRVAIVNETMARVNFGSPNPLGRKFASFGTEPPEWVEVVGVAADMKFDSLRTAAPSIIYRPYSQFGGYQPHIMTLELRARRDALAMGPALRREVAAASRGFVLGDILTESKMVDDTLVRERLLATVGSFFGGVALLLAALGLYGTVGYAVSRRTQEIGIRMALGARQGQVVRMLLGESLAPVAIGAAVGMAVAMEAGRAVAGLLFGIRPQDPGAILGSAALLAATAAAAAFVPAMRACRAAPVEALRNE